MLELIIVMVILAILFAIGISGLLSAQALPKKRMGNAGAKSLDQGIREFMLDHGGRVPNAHSPQDWDVRRGPLDIEGRPYLKVSQFTAFQDGSVQLCRAAPTAVSAAVVTPPLATDCATPQRASAALVYHSSPAGGDATGYWIDVFGRNRLTQEWNPQDLACRYTGGRLPAGVEDSC